MPATTDMFPRNAQLLVLEALADTRVVFIAGARQVGKSTLAQQIARAEEFSLDVRATRENFWSIWKSGRVVTLDVAD